ncbi:flagellar hook-associated protein FlgK [Alteribacter keqinensis]|uniref:Flagellar hook-associated protein 1 n=1 Tax=Alteribacter keqinensis TaxID=2483800 RepID=A0A3M7TPU2_9BACI|nr:flagellar hook-associated protein FlgK [Alteribacter keqinensis]RNA67568.1 flagellar hook-associated protein FlgK [Alteribacter keqinensis]
MSTFHGLETARRAINTQQSAIHTTGHNIANANTQGYSRQRVNFTPTEAFPNPGFNKPSIPGQLGTGVKAGEIERIRESFLDLQYRKENNKHGYWSARHTALEKIEDIMNEPTEDGIAQTMDRFWQSLQDLSVYPEDSGARSVVRQNGIALAETFNYTAQSLEAVQRDYKNQLGVENTRVNSLLDQINNVNQQIASVEPHGYLANDLYDARDNLVDELSEYVNISVEQVSSGGMAKENAAGRYTIKLLNEHGQDMGVTLVNGRSLEAARFELSYDEDSGLIDGISVGGETFDPEEFNSYGKLKGSIETHGYLADGEEFGLIPEMMQSIDQMVYAFTSAFNDVHESGMSLYEMANGEESIAFFDFAGGLNISAGNVKGAALGLKVTDDILGDLDKIAAATVTGGEAFSGDGSNALALANVKDNPLNFGDSTTNVQSFYQGVIGALAVSTNEAERMSRNTDQLRESVDDRRQSISGVSLDEEMTNLIKFQHAYNAAARNMTTIDEMLDRIINGMGVVGR